MSLFLTVNPTSALLCDFFRVDSAVFCLVMILVKSNNINLL